MAHEASEISDSSKADDEEQRADAAAGSSADDAQVIKEVESVNIVVGGRTFSTNGDDEDQKEKKQKDEDSDDSDDEDDDEDDDSDDDADKDDGKDDDKKEDQKDNKQKDEDSDDSDDDEDDDDDDDDDGVHKPAALTQAVTTGSSGTVKAKASAKAAAKTNASAPVYAVSPPAVADSSVTSAPAPVAEEAESTNTNTESTPKLSPATGSVLYVIPSWHHNYHTRVAAVRKTWGRRLPASSLIIAGDEESMDPPVISLKQQCGDDKGDHGRSHVCRLAAALVLAKQNIGTAQWVFVSDDDAYANTTNIEEALGQINANESIMAGFFGCGRNLCPDEEDKLGNLCGGGGFAVSKAALDELVGSTDESIDDFQKEFTDLGTGNKFNDVYYGDLAASCTARKHNVELRQLDGLNPFRLGGMGEQGQRAGKSSTKLPWGYVWAIHISDVKPLTFHYITPGEMIDVEEEFERNTLPPAINTITLSGFNHSGLNGNFTRSTDPDYTIGDRETYWTDARDYFMYFCRQFNRWTVARSTEFMYIAAKSGQECHGIGSQGPNPMPNQAVNWLELMTDTNDTKQSKWVRRHHAGVSNLRVKPEALVLLSTSEVHRQIVDFSNMDPRFVERYQDAPDYPDAPGYRDAPDSE